MQSTSNPLYFKLHFHSTSPAYKQAIVTMRARTSNALFCILLNLLSEKDVLGVLPLFVFNRKFCPSRIQDVVHRVRVEDALQHSASLLQLKAYFASAIPFGVEFETEFLGCWPTTPHMVHRHAHRGEVDLSPRDVSSLPPCTLSLACQVCTDLLPSTHAVCLSLARWIEQSS